MWPPSACIGTRTHARTLSQKDIDHSFNKFCKSFAEVLKYKGSQGTLWRHSQAPLVLGAQLLIREAEVAQEPDLGLLKYLEERPLEPTWRCNSEMWHSVQRHGSDEVLRDNEIFPGPSHGVPGACFFYTAHGRRRSCAGQETRE